MERAGDQLSKIKAKLVLGRQNELGECESVEGSEHKEGVPSPPPPLQKGRNDNVQREPA